MRVISSGQHNWNIVGNVLANTPCGSVETYVVTFFSSGGPIVTNTFKISVLSTPTLSISGPNSFCNLTGGQILFKKIQLEQVFILGK
jgi:hypothetical protein